MIAATQTRRPLVVDWDSLEMLRKFAEALLEASPALLPHEARRLAQTFWADGWRVNDRGQIAKPVVDVARN